MSPKRNHSLELHYRSNSRNRCRGEIVVVLLHKSYEVEKERNHGDRCGYMVKESSIHRFHICLSKVECDSKRRSIPYVGIPRYADKSRAKQSTLAKVPE
ncbi:hypothetical protein P8452_55314 [Trifolium repens]|nr:hypothetical protein P8452_55314 [Trifolium repens]